MLANKEEKNMKWFYNRIYRKQKGFTLVELMVVIIILAVLTGIAIPSYLALRNRARIQATRSEMLNIATAISVYEADRGSYPADTFAALETALEGDDVEGTGPYMDEVPNKDAWDGDYDYDLTAGTYTLTSTAGTEDAGDDIVIINGAFSGE